MTDTVTIPGFAGEIVEPGHVTYDGHVVSDADADVGRGYRSQNLVRLADLKRKYDPDNVFHLNQNIRPASGPV